jgi:uncharacterized protein YndB with AHSA1/START domain
MESTTDRVTNGLEVRQEIEIAATPETVWELIVDPEKAVRWWGQAVEMDARPGGSFRVEVSSRSIARGEIVEADPPRRLVYTFGWELGGAGPDLVPPGSTTVEIDLVATETGTTLRLLHRGLTGAKAASDHGDGWAHYLGRLAVVATGGDPGPDPWSQPAPEAGEAGH